MTDLLIRDVPNDVVAAIDAKAKRLGLSRTEFLRRQLSQAAARSDQRVSAEDLNAFASSFADLAGPDVMARAWQ